jgi:hypothetical protein
MLLTYRHHPPLCQFASAAAVTSTMLMYVWPELEYRYVCWTSDGALIEHL